MHRAGGQNEGEDNSSTSVRSLQLVPFFISFGWSPCTLLVPLYIAIVDLFVLSLAGVNHAHVHSNVGYFLD
jgi:hypothetical protein